MRIAVIGASGWLGGAVAREAIARGHEVTAVGRDAGRLSAVEGATVVVADVDDHAALQRAVAGHDAVVASVTDRTTGDRSLIPRTAQTLLDVLPAAGVGRLVFVGGGGSLESEPGIRGIDRPEFPEQYRAEAEAQAEALDLLRRADTPVDWSYFSPPPHDLVAGEKEGSYRAQAGDAPVVNDAGESRITSADFAAALVDELESPQFVRRRFTAAYR